MTVYIRLVLAGRVTMSYVAGVLFTAFGGAVFSLFRGAGAFDALHGALLFAVAALIVSTPLYFLAVVFAFAFAKAIVAQPGMWSAAAALIIVGLNFLIPPFDVRFTLFYVIPIAVVAGACFWIWSAWRPVAEISN